MMDDLPAQGDAQNTPNPTADPQTHQPLIGNPGIDEQKQRERRKERCRRKLHKAPVWIEAACAILLVVITGTYTYYAIRQANAAKKTAKAAFDAIEEAKRDNIASINTQQQIAQTALAKSQENFVASSNAAAQQFSDTLKQMQAQTRTQVIAASAAKSEADTAEKEALVSEENLRAIIEAKVCQIERIGVGEKIAARCDFTNAGHSEAFNVRGASDTKRWQSLPDGPIPVNIIESGDNLAVGGEITVTYLDSLPATTDFLNGMPELTVNDDPGNATLFFFTRFEYSSFGRKHHTEICYHLTKSNPEADATPVVKTGYLLRQCQKWHSAD